MGRNKHNALAAAAGRSVKDRHQRAARDIITVPPHLAILPEKNIQSKHKSYFQLFENTDARDKKLEVKVTTDLNPPPGYAFLPSGNPELTNACKELTREQNAMIFVVSGANGNNSHGEEDGKLLALQVHRMGHHVRLTILEEAKKIVGKEVASAGNHNWQLPETQEEINAQAEAAMRDLFPRIPNFDKQQILEHAFKKNQGKYGKTLVGTSDLPLYRRVQLAVLAHIRHVHTRYDKILKEQDWSVARKAVERPSLDILVKWRGDEETGRDQLGDILREVVVISDADDDSDSDDSEDSDAEEESSDENSAENIGTTPVNGLPEPIETGAVPNGNRQRRRKAKTRRDRVAKPQGVGRSRKNQRSKRDQRGFNRYEAAQATRNQAWEEALSRSRGAQNPGDPSQVPMQGVLSQNVQRQPSVEIVSPVHRVDPVLRYTRPASQPIYDRTQWNEHPAHPVENPATNYDRQQQFIPRESRPHSGFGPSEGVVVGRRTGMAAHHSSNGPILGRLHHGELKDFLVPSVEPISPHSRLDASQSSRRVAPEESMRPEQVPAGRPRQYFPMENRPLVMPPQNHPADWAFRPEVTEHREHVQRNVPQYQSHHERDHRPHPIALPQEEHRVYYTREPVHEAYHPPGPSMAGTTRLVRVHREARPMDTRAAEPPRVREYSPRRLEENRHAPPSAAFGPEVRRHIVYREASASGLDAQVRGPIPGPRPLYYEVQPPAQMEFRQGNPPEARPQSFHPAHPVQPQAPGGYYEDQTRRPTHGRAEPNHRTHTEWLQRGYPPHERTPSNHSMQPAAPSGSGDVQYLYQRPAPPPGVIVIR